MVIIYKDLFRSKLSFSCEVSNSILWWDAVAANDDDDDAWLLIYCLDINVFWFLLSFWLAQQTRTLKILIFHQLRTSWFLKQRNQLSFQTREPAESLDKGTSWVLKQGNQLSPQTREPAEFSNKGTSWVLGQRNQLSTQTKEPAESSNKGTSWVLKQGNQLSPRTKEPAEPIGNV